MCGRKSRTGGWVTLSNSSELVVIMLQLRPPVVESHDGITVVREDLCCDFPSGKLRGVLPWFHEMRAAGVVGVINHATSHSNSHAITAVAAAAAGLEAVTYVNCKHPTPQTKLAETLGASVVYWGAMRLSVLRARIREVSRPGYRRLPWALCGWDALSHVATLAGEIPGEYDAHVIPVGGGGYAAAVARGLRAAERPGVVYGVVTSGSEASTKRRLAAVTPFHHVTVMPAPSVEPTPFPSDPEYEHYAWPVARVLAARGLSVCFWSVGVRLGET